jgi:hypothetical protein
MRAWSTPGCRTAEPTRRSRSAARAAASWSALSQIVKCGERPAARAWLRRNRAQKAWNVPIVSFSARFAPTSFPMRSRISPAALRVKVIARTFSGATWCASSQPVRTVMTRVLPEPAPAEHEHWGPRPCRTASRCASLRTFEATLLHAGRATLGSEPVERHPRTTIPLYRGREARW